MGVHGNVLWKEGFSVFCFFLFFFKVVNWNVPVKRIKTWEFFCKLVENYFFYQSGVVLLPESAVWRCGMPQIWFHEFHKGLCTRDQIHLNVKKTSRLILWYFSSSVPLYVDFWTNLCVFSLCSKVLCRFYFLPRLGVPSEPPLTREASSALY